MFCFASSSVRASRSASLPRATYVQFKSTKLFQGVRFSSEKPDPFARRPNAVCDPYGQGGKALNSEEARRLLNTTLEKGWALIDNEPSSTPIALIREYCHKDYIAAASFIKTVAAVGEINNHYPGITLERRLLSREKRWEIITSVRCHTVTLKGLSGNDFQIAMLIDVEAARPEVKKYIMDEVDS
mmetsp:Transcript_18373/g.27227  ORF Transcript_18373/g.27227 Transcript_18373/m.27227 type:complete len:185 (-) Transcript_18373:2073-2627(-)